MQNADLSEWQEIFVVLCTFAKQDEFSNLTEQLGQRLEFQYTLARNSDAAQAKEHRKNAVLCYLAAGKLEKVAGMWIDEMKEEELALRTNSKDGADASHDGTLYSARAEALQTFMEKITVFQSAVGYVDVDLQQPTQDSLVAETGARLYKLAPLYDRIHEYVELLADQGLITPALRFAGQTPADYRPQGPIDQGAATGSLPLRSRSACSRRRALAPRRRPLPPRPPTVLHLPLRLLRHTLLRPLRTVTLPTTRTARRARLLLPSRRCHRSPQCPRTRTPTQPQLRLPSPLSPPRSRATRLPFLRPCPT